MPNQLSTIQNLFGGTPESLYSHPICVLCNDNILNAAPEIYKKSPPAFNTISYSSLLRSILVRNNKLFCIKYTPQDMLRARRNLIAVDLDITDQLKIEPEKIGMYHILFLTRHPAY